jgi:hypothetical protein
MDRYVKCKDYYNSGKLCNKMDIPYIYIRLTVLTVNITELHEITALCSTLLFLEFQVTCLIYHTH